MGERDWQKKEAERHTPDFIAALVKIRISNAADVCSLLYTREQEVKETERNSMNVKEIIPIYSALHRQWMGIPNRPSVRESQSLIETCQNGWWLWRSGLINVCLTAIIRDKTDRARDKIYQIKMKLRRKAICFLGEVGWMYEEQQWIHILLGTPCKKTGLRATVHSVYATRASSHHHHLYQRISNIVFGVSPWMTDHIYLCRKVHTLKDHWNLAVFFKLWKEQLSKFRWSNLQEFTF